MAPVYYLCGEKAKHHITVQYVLYWYNYPNFICYALPARFLPSKKRGNGHTLVPFGINNNSKNNITTHLIYTDNSNTDYSKTIRHNL